MAHACVRPPFGARGRPAQVLRKLGRERTRACRLCDSATIVSFAVIRLGVQPFCFYRLWVDDSLPAAVWLIGVVGNTALIVLNCVWFRALLRAAARPSKHV